MATRPLRVLSLCSGAGGLDLGLRVALPTARTVCYIEREAYAVALLEARMADQTLDDAPVWSDLSTFDSGAWRGSVDIVLAGFPCQPASVAGKRRGAADERWLWPHVWRIFNECGARMLIFENVGGLRSKNLLGQILVDMAHGGLAAEWTSLAAGEVGASHRRTRLFLVAYSRLGGDHPHQHGGVEREGRQGATGACASGYEMAYSEGDRREQWGAKPAVVGYEPNGDGFGLFAPSPADPRWGALVEAAPHLEPAVCRMVNGLADRIHRLRAAGNGVVPLQAAAAITHLLQRLVEG